MYGKFELPQYSIMLQKNNKTGRLPSVSRVVAILCVYGGFWNGLDAY